MIIKCLGTVRVLLVWALLAALGCKDAPRDNPLDPLSPKLENHGQLLVRVQSFYPPYSPLPNVALLLSPAETLLHTNAEGNALFSELAPGNYTLTAGASGFVSDSIDLEIRPRTTGQHIFRLNAMPRIGETLVYSEHISRWFPLNRDLYRLVIAARVSDADGAQDLVTIKATSATHGELGALTLRPETGRYELALTNFESPKPSLPDFLGEPLMLEASDREGARSHSTPLLLTRVIEPTPIADTPSAFTATGTRPRFQWKRLTLPYHFTFRVDISQFSPEQQFATLFESIHNIPADSTASFAPRALPEGTYYWTVSIVDRQGNVSRSKEATFQVQ